ncbi:MAG TPA: thiamine phosphate synthase [Polyangiaceae bacterium]|jgi:thiamine-phosphate pyrophosphorylase|nr:thiamine phosphate synthase [Polyangiaceae bacterium]
MADFPRLIVFSDTSRATQPAILDRFSALAQAARPGTVLFTLRDYGSSVRARLTLGTELRSLAELNAQRFGVADRADLGRALGARALHLPEAGLRAHDARRYLGPDAFLSRACHDPLRAADPDADALLLSPIFEARKGRPALGLAALALLRRGRTESGAVPALYALGGVDAGNAAACLAAGATGVAVIGAALVADHSPLLKALEISRH